MKTAFVLLAAVGIVAAQDLTGVPPCAQECIAAALPQVGCALTDAVCQCKDETKTKLAPLVTPCMISKCTSAELQQALAASEKICAAVSASPPPTTSAPATKTEPSGTATVTDTDTDTETKTKTAKPSEPAKNTTATTVEPATTTTKATTATSAVVTAGAAQLPIVAGAGLLAVLIGAVAGL